MVGFHTSLGEETNRPTQGGSDPVRQSKSFQEQIIDQIDALPPFPLVFYKILDITENIHGSREELLRALSLDQAIVAKVLQIANSAYYGLEKKVSSLDRAVALIGENMVRETAIYCSTHGLLNRPLQRYSLSARQFWEHSVTVSRAARCIAIRILPQIREKALVAGLIHDIGKLALNGLIDHALEEEFRRRLENGYPLDEVERELLGIDHCDAGRLFAEKWSYPDSIRNAIAFHHHPGKAENHIHLVYLIQFADRIAHALNAGVSAQNFLGLNMNVLGWNTAIGYLGLRREEVELLFSDIEAEINGVGIFLDL